MKQLRETEIKYYLVQLDAKNNIIAEMVGGYDSLTDAKNEASKPKWGQWLLRQTHVDKIGIIKKNMCRS